MNGPRQNVFAYSLQSFALRRVVEQEKVTQEDITAVHNRFLALDRDNNGFVTRDEIGRDRDRDGDGFINPHEL